MMIPSKIFLIVLGLLVTILAAAFFSSDLLRDSGTRSDEELKSVFMKYPDSFTKLERLLRDDPALFYISETELFRRGERGVVSKFPTPDEYRTIFSQTGIFSSTRDVVIDLAYFALPTSMISLDRRDPNESFFEEKGYALILAPDETVQQLLGTGREYGNVEFRQIEQRWYTYKRVAVSKPE